MIPREFLTMASGNLWRMKLRAGLTISGVVIGIGALVSMLSFAFGVQQNAASQFRSLGLFHTLHVMPAPAESADSLSAVPLDDAALERIAGLDGVTFVYPQDTFDARLEWGAESKSVTAQALPARFAEAREFGKLIAGRFFSSDSVSEAVLRHRLVKQLNANPDSILGDTILLRVAGYGDLAREFMTHLLGDLDAPPQVRQRADQFAGLFLPTLGANERELVICGVAELESGFGFRLHDVLLPSGVATGLDRLGFSDPIELLSRLSSPGGRGYSLAVVTLSTDADYQAVADSVEAMGLRPLSFADQFAEMRKAFLIFDLIFGVIGLIALAVASLGIVNTMIMSIMERTREIGILKSLGAQSGQIQLLFLLESGLIGLIGSVGGLTLGWIVSRIGSLVVKRIMIAQDAPVMDLFHIPSSVAFGAVAFGVLISLLAGLYPAARAARVDPVQALRQG